MLEKQYFLKNAYGYVFENTQYNVKYFDFYNWCILQQSNNIPTRYRQMNSGALEIRVSVLSCT